MSFLAETPLLASQSSIQRRYASWSGSGGGGVQKTIPRDRVSSSVEPSDSRANQNGR